MNKLTHGHFYWDHILRYVLNVLFCDKQTALKNVNVSKVWGKFPRSIPRRRLRTKYLVFILQRRINDVMNGFVATQLPKVKKVVLQNFKITKKGKCISRGIKHSFTFAPAAKLQLYCLNVQYRHFKVVTIVFTKFPEDGNICVTRFLSGAQHVPLKYREPPGKPRSSSTASQKRAQTWEREESCSTSSPPISTSHSVCALRRVCDSRRSSNDLEPKHTTWSSESKLLGHWMNSEKNCASLNSSL